MRSLDLDYRIKTASRQSILDHLRACSTSFAPPLESYVDIELYTDKIFRNAVTFESWDGDLLVGLIAAYYNNRDAGIGYITNVSVMSEYQGRGIASQLLTKTIEYGRDAGFVRVDLELAIKNSIARTLYEHHGFHITEIKNDSMMLMSCSLSSSLTK